MTWQSFSLDLRLNSEVCVWFSYHRHLHTPPNVLLLSLALADFVIGLVMPFQILITEGCWILGDVMCTLVCILDYISTSASVGTITLISVDGYVAICHPLHYSTKVTLRGVTIGSCLCWALSVLYNGLILSDNLTHPGQFRSCLGDCVLVISYHAGVVDMIFTFICPVIVIVLLCTRVFMVAVSQAHAMRSHTGRDASCQENGDEGSQDSRRCCSCLFDVSLSIFLFVSCWPGNLVQCHLSSSGELAVLSQLWPQPSHLCVLLSLVS